MTSAIPSESLASVRWFRSDIREIPSLKECFSIGGGCPGRWRSHHPWKCLWSEWAQYLVPWARWCLVEGWTWSWRSFPNLRLLWYLNCKGGDIRRQGEQKGELQVTWEELDSREVPAASLEGGSQKCCPRGWSGCFPALGPCPSNSPASHCWLVQSKQLVLFSCCSKCVFLQSLCSNTTFITCIFSFMSYINSV